MPPKTKTDQDSLRVLVEHNTLAEALAAFQGEMPVVAKDKTASVGRYSYTYADLRSLTEAIVPLLSKHGLSFLTLPGHNDQGRAVVRGKLLHISGEYEQGELPLFGNTAQEIGSSLTYSRRYLMGCLTGVVTDDDDDGSIANQARRTHAEPPPPPAKPVGAVITPEQKSEMVTLFDTLVLSQAEREAGIRNYSERTTNMDDLTEQEAERVLVPLRRALQNRQAAPTQEKAEALVNRALGGTPVDSGDTLRDSE